MTAAGRRVRLALTAVVLALLLAGTLVGTDHDFPLGPFRMYSTTGRTNGAVRTADLVGIRAGREIDVRPEDVGLRRAELEGQYPRFRSDPRLLAALAGAFEDEGVRLDELRLVQRIRRIRGGRRAGTPTETEVLATWRREP